MLDAAVRVHVQGTWTGRQAGSQASASVACWTARDGQTCSGSPVQTRQVRAYELCPRLYHPEYNTATDNYIIFIIIVIITR